jgi:hypothetical protein
MSNDPENAGEKKPPVPAWIISHKGLIRLLVVLPLLAIVLGGTIVVTDLATILIDTVATVIVLSGLDKDAPFVFLAGFYVGLVSLITFDWYKRVQGLLLMTGTLIGAFALSLQGLLFRSIEWSAPEVVWMFPVGVGVAWAAGGLRRGYRAGKPYRFPRALLLFNAIAFIVVVVGFVEAHRRYQTPLVAVPSGFATQALEVSGVTLGNWGVVDLVASGALLVLLRQFTGYEARGDAFAEAVGKLGP